MTIESGISFLLLVQISRTPLEVSEITPTTKENTSTQPHTPKDIIIISQIMFLFFRSCSNLHVRTPPSSLIASSIPLHHAVALTDTNLQPHTGG
ncbi:hypothetical protein OIU74_020646 [Salix koriyanagi]|uniref:Uncharacterized protein n=1 Tax=Salix koriyanagi TaxID=2511006 RepID=A0A9Q0SMN3_9ROSI|nr:hypothetical protein OIU74_020646 [Salix koriyanagi]